MFEAIGVEVDVSGRSIEQRVDARFLKVFGRFIPIRTTCQRASQFVQSFASSRPLSRSADGISRKGAACE